MSVQSRNRPRLSWPGAILPVRLGRFSIRVEVRALVVTTLVVVSALACALWSLTIGSAGLGVADLIEALRMARPAWVNMG